LRSLNGVFKIILLLEQTYIGMLANSTGCTKWLVPNAYNWDSYPSSEYYPW